MKLTKLTEEMIIACGFKKEILFGETGYRYCDNQLLLHDKASECPNVPSALEELANIILCYHRTKFEQQGRKLQQEEFRTCLGISENYAGDLHVTDC